MCDKAGIEGYFSNHSGKHTCAAALFKSVLMNRKYAIVQGISNLAARDYKVSSIVQQKVGSALLDAPCPASLQVVNNSHDTYVSTFLNTWNTGFSLSR